MDLGRAEGERAEGKNNESPWCTKDTVTQNIPRTVTNCLSEVIQLIVFRFGEEN